MGKDFLGQGLKAQETKQTNKNKQVGLYQTKQLVYRKGNSQQQRGSLQKGEKSYHPELMRNPKNSTANEKIL